MHNGNKSARIGWWGVLLLVTLLYALLEALTPLQFDDLQFAAGYGSESGFSLERWVRFATEVRAADNSRIANLLAPFTSVISPWPTIWPLIAGGSMGAVVALISRLSGFGRNWKAAGIVWLFCTLFLPWRNNLLVADYMLNYIVASAITLLFLKQLAELRQCNALRLAGMLLLAIIAGGWHEQFSLSSCAGIAMAWVMARQHPSRAQIAVASVYAISAVVFFLSPGMISRLGDEVGNSYSDGLLKAIVDLALVAAAVGITFVMLLSRAGRRHLSRLMREPRFILFFISMLAGAVISLGAGHKPRSATWPEICAMIVLAYMLRPTLSRITQRGRWISIVAAIAALAICTLHGIVVARWQWKMWEESRDINAMFDSGISTAYYDITMPEEVPFYTLYFPTRTAWVEPYQYHMIKEMRGRHCAVVARDLAEIGKRESQELGAGMKRLGSAIWTADSVDEEGTADLILEDGRVAYRMPYMSQRFEAADGRHLSYIKFLRIDSRSIRAVN